ncbi:MAG TPA: type VI secretion system tip protein TssI/VgrG [Minicystis sp.]|nr:type VI secretion system tip protein TssI/VgrG [Minicystis sp.]
MSHEPTGAFELFSAVTKPPELRVLAWRGVEAIGAPFSFEIVAACAIDAADDLAAKLLGRPAVFVSNTSGAAPEARRGVVVEARIEADPVAPDATSNAVARAAAGRLRITLASRLALLELRVHSRIFQDRTSVDILRELLGAWQIECETRLLKSYPKRVYCTQYAESDLAFFGRVAGKDGIGFYLEHAPFDAREADEPGPERVVLFDHAGAYAKLGGPGGGALAHASQRFAPGARRVESFALERRLRPEFVRLGDFDFRKPRLPLRAAAAVANGERSPIGEALGGERLSVYRHHDRAELESDPRLAAEIDDAIARLRLSQLRQEHCAGSGRARTMGLFPGCTFTLDEHPAAALNRDYVVTRVEHEGRVPEAGGADGDVYSNAFSCVPADVVVRAPVPPPRVQQAIETAIVVGPAGKDIHCDEHGRVKVKFHWDLDGTSDETSSCWLRAAQPWAGTNWGTQFVPRVGTEVLVGFVGGDVDRPVILGSLYNAVRPWPFRMPADARKTGFRTQAAPGGGASELVFDDEKGREVVSLKSQRDFTAVVENDYELTIKRGETVRVDGARVHTLGGEATTTVLGARTDTVAKDFSVSVLGSHDLAVSGDADVRVSGDRTTRIEGTDRLELQGGAEATHFGDQTVRVLGHLVTVVGQHDARRSSTLHVEGSATQYTTGTTEIVSDRDIVLRVGESSIRLTKDGVEIVAKKVRLHAEDVEADATEQLELFAKKQIALKAERLDALADERIRLKAEAAQIQLDRNARVDAELVKLNCSPDPVDDLAPPDYTPPKPTIVRLTDEHGKPLAGRRYVIFEADGGERSGTLDEQGEVELYLDDAAEIVFPDVDGARKG